ncbi:hypothetical protein H0H81_001224 [Sphagnurus paluster]|uniref:F-box domain-containing protein n=1 Tax=Sphagnurus paluster TaxID=117069 RepID=A0A9P7FXL9_9AGAR|nr:hypothetical protein H0H81_001224 [Sphagnurus paluster]
MKIFLLAVDDTEDRYETILRPIIISQVSTRWRNVAISTGALWSNIILTFPTSRGQLSRAITWLKRSRSYPLAIYLDFRDPSWDWDLAESSHPFRWQDMEALLRLLILHVKRWKQFELLTDTWAPIFTVLHYSRRVNSAPILESLSLSRCNAFFASKNATFAPVGMKTPVPLFGGIVLGRLREVAFTGVHVDWSESQLRNLTTLELRYLASDVTPTKVEFANILDSCPSLRHLSLIGRGPRADTPTSGNSSPVSENAEATPPPSRIIELKFLASFTFGFVEAGYACEVLSMLSLPNIKELSLIGLGDLDTLAFYGADDATPILELLTRRDHHSTSTETTFPISNIHSLKLDSIYADKTAFIRFFHETHKLHYLGLFNSQHDSLIALQPHSYDSHSSNFCLPCPTLRYLECRNTDPQMLLDVVELRSATSPLDHITLELEDVTPEIRQKLLDAGVGVTLDRIEFI